MALPLGIQSFVGRSREALAVADAVGAETVPVEGFVSTPVAVERLCCHTRGYAKAKNTRM